MEIFMGLMYILIPLSIFIMSKIWKEGEMRTKRKTIDEVVEILINKMLEPHNVGLDYVIANPQIEDQLWCNYYTWTKQESEDFKKFTIELLKRELKLSKKESERQYNHFFFMWGLKIKEDGAI